MSGKTNTEQLMAHLMEEARQQYGAESFTIIANPHLGSIGVRFPVPDGTQAKRPSLPDELEPTRWEEAVAEVVDDMFGNPYMTWRWPAAQDHSVENLVEFARAESQRTGEPIETR